ncbi:hypothetical protein BDW_03610 [Bdellovibrio bacteriovorus W]|nr:hypothetical protein BDW_03610 [Bdellovibrio bacteriovorus W]
MRFFFIVTPFKSLKDSEILYSNSCAKEFGAKKEPPLRSQERHFNENKKRRTG